MEWMPIETAPKDGTPILACSNFVFITAWKPNQCKGWGIIDSCCGYYEDMHPSYWMPLPKTPGGTE